jgi:hypothetical protein
MRDYLPGFERQARAFENHLWAELISPELLISPSFGFLKDRFGGCRPDACHAQRAYP